jgi:predicted cupin superfamily sugar epimerase
MTIEEVIALFGLEPHPCEGGYYRETYRCDEELDGMSLPARYGEKRDVSTCIYYLITEGNFSAFHRLASDEIFHFYLGDPVVMVQLLPDGDVHEIMLGQDVLAGEQLQVVVPRGVWQASYLKEGGSWALLGCTVAPGFDMHDYEHGDWEALLRQYPAHHAHIMKLTRPG